MPALVYFWGIDGLQNCNAIHDQLTHSVIVRLVKYSIALQPFTSPYTTNAGSIEALSLYRPHFRVSLGDLYGWGEEALTRVLPLPVLCGSFRFQPRR